jgi:hypothetical protein
VLKMNELSTLSKEAYSMAIRHGINTKEKVRGIIDNLPTRLAPFEIELRELVEEYEIDEERQYFSGIQE